MKLNKLSKIYFNKRVVKENISVIISLLSFLISICVVIKSCVNTREEWEILNLGDLVVTEIEMKSCITYPKYEYDTIKFGYDRLFYESESKALITLPFELVIYDLEHSNPITSSRKLFTYSECINEINRLDLGSLFMQNRVGIAKHFQINYQLKNIGKTQVTNINTEMSVKDIAVNNTFKVSSQMQKIIELKNNEEMKGQADIYVFDRNYVLKDTLQLNLNLTYYNIKKEKIEKEIILKWFRERDNWYVRNYLLD